MGTNGAKERARSELTRLVAARLDNDGFRWEAAAILRRAIGFDGWCWQLTDPAPRLPTRSIGENVVAGQDIRLFGCARRHPQAWEVSRNWPAAQPVTVLSAVTGGDLAQDPAWREIFGPEGVGDYLTRRPSPRRATGSCPLRRARAAG